MQSPVFKSDMRRRAFHSLQHANCSANPNCAAEPPTRRADRCCHQSPRQLSFSLKHLPTHYVVALLSQSPAPLPRGYARKVSIPRQCARRQYTLSREAGRSCRTQDTDLLRSINQKHRPRQQCVRQCSPGASIRWTTLGLTGPTGKQ